MSSAQSCRGGKRPSLDSTCCHLSLSHLPRDMLPLMEPHFQWIVESPPVSPKLVADLHVTTSTYSTQPPSAKRRRRVRRVSFASEALVYSSDRTLQEVEQSWYNREEVAVFKNERREIIRALKSVNFCLDLVDPARYCLRGFEAYFSVEFNKAIKFVRETVLTSVFSEQARQRTLRIQDDEALRMACHSASHWAMCHAIDVGKNDAAFVRLYRLS